MWKICFFSVKKNPNLGIGKSKRVEADFQAEEQAEGNQPRNISCSAFTPSALNALPREAQITVIRGNNSQSSVFFREASDLSKIILALPGEAHSRGKGGGAGGGGGCGRRCRRGSRLHRAVLAQGASGGKLAVRIKAT